MSRLIVDVSGEQHQAIKALAAMEGKSIKDYVLERVLPEPDDEQTAWQALKDVLHSRIESAQKHGVSSKSVAELTEETLRNLGKA